LKARALPKPAVEKQGEIEFHKAKKSDRDVQKQCLSSQRDIEEERHLVLKLICDTSL